MSSLPASLRTTCLPRHGLTCSQPLGTDSEALASDQAEEALAIQGLSRPPCDGPRTQHRVVGLVDLAVAALAFVVTLVVWRRPKAQAKASPSLAASYPPRAARWARRQTGRYASRPSSARRANGPCAIVTRSGTEPQTRSRAPLHVSTMSW